MLSIKFLELINVIPKKHKNTLLELLIAKNKIKKLHIFVLNYLIKNKFILTFESKKELISKVFSKETKINKEDRFRKICSDLLKDVEDILITIKINNSKELNQILLLEYLKEFQMDKFFEKKIELFKHEIILNKEYNINQSFQIFSLEKIKYEFYINHNSSTKINNINSFSESLDKYYYFQKLQLICHAINENHFSDKKTIINNAENIINTIITNQCYNEPIIHIYIQIYTLLKDINNFENYFLLKKTIKKQNNIHIDEQKIIFQYIINFCIIQLRKGELDFEIELLNIYKQSLIFIKDNISTSRFKNIVNLSLKLEEFDFVEDFIKKFGNLIDDEQKENIINYNLATLYFAKKKYNDTIDILNITKGTDLFYTLAIKVLLIKSFFELKEIQFIESTLSSFRIYVLRNKKMTLISKKIYTDYIITIKKMINIINLNYNEINSLKIKIETKKDLPDKKWILEKLNQIQNKEF